MADLRPPIKVGVPGVSYTPPPPSLLADATRIATATFAELAPGKKGGVVGVATTQGWQAAIVHREGEHVEVALWIGKPSGWNGPLTGGARVEISW